MIRLRADTAEEHRRLEDGLALLVPPLSADRFRAVLARFHGFHQIWDAAARRAFVDEPDLITPRLRLAGLERDLKALGVSDDDLAAMPADMAAASLVRDLPTAIGSLYVIEGSALGGQLIGRALAGQAWLPDGGLAFFSPHGAQTGARWQEFRRRVRAISAPDADARIVAGARATFMELYHWMQPVLARPAKGVNAGDD